ncbi:MAG: aminoacetone oxidase family FAD-binding enzyme, partial [Ruminococcus sp.]|nr:aminoacetone oxidase family FAD-binding enzyme [Ruminococcus sp.]
MQSTHFDIIIIGGGAAGLSAAISAKRNNRNSKVAILELQSRVGKKLLATGNGRCNLTNMYISKSNYHGSFDICETLNKYSPEKLLDFFDGIGLVCSAENNGLVYPLCKQASAVLDILRLTTEKLGVTTICDCKVELVKKNKGVFNIRTNTQNYSCNKVIVATGGKASPSCGGTGAGLDILRNLGHKITPLYPILRPIEVKCDYMKSLKGIRATGSVSLYDSDKKLISESGEIQFSENALSGICVFNLTPYLYNAKSPFILINLMDDYSENEIYNELKKRKKLFANEDTENYFTGLFHKRIGNALFRHCNISLTKRCS